MAKVLTQEEVDSLLNGIDEGKVETETDIPDGGDAFQAYDFSNTSFPDHQRMPALGIINERFISFINASLSTATGIVIDVNVNDIGSVKYGDFCRSLPLPASLNILKMEPLRGFALLVLEGSLVFAFVDTFFGGSCSTHVKLEGRSFTAIETKIIERIVGIIIEDLQKAWQDVYPVGMKYMRSEVDPQFAGIAKPEDMIVSTKFGVDIGNYSGTMTLCLPYTLLEPIKTILRDNYKSENIEIDETWRQGFQQKIGQMQLGMSCTLGTTRLKGRELLGMKADDILLLDQKATDPVVINVEGNAKFVGYPGSLNNRKAIRIEKRLK